MAEGLPPAEVVRVLTAADAGRESRQFHAIDAQGRIAAHTGSACIDWCGHLAGEGYSVAGNMLAGPQVLDETAAAYESNAALPFAERLLVALEAGDAAGGDKRGKQAAALLIYTTEDYPFLDLRVDDHAEPFVELRRLYEKSLERFQPFLACLPSKARPAGITDRAVIEERIAKFQATRTPMTALLEVRDLRTRFATEDGEFTAVDGVSFRLDAGRTLGLVGESGCGKSVTSLSIMGLVPQPPGRVRGRDPVRRRGPAPACPHPRCASCAATASR